MRIVLLHLNSYRFSWYAHPATSAVRGIRGPRHRLHLRVLASRLQFLPQQRLWRHHSRPVSLLGPRVWKGGTVHSVAL